MSESTQKLSIQKLSKKSNPKIPMQIFGFFLDSASPRYERHFQKSLCASTKIKKNINKK